MLCGQWPWTFLDKLISILFLKIFSGDRKTFIEVQTCIDTTGKFSYQNKTIIETISSVNKCFNGQKTPVWL